METSTWEKLNRRGRKRLPAAIPTLTVSWSSGDLPLNRRTSRIINTYLATAPWQLHGGVNRTNPD